MPDVQFQPGDLGDTDPYDVRRLINPPDMNLSYGTDQNLSLFDPGGDSNRGSTAPTLSTQPVARNPLTPDFSAIESQLRGYGKELYDPSDLEGVKRNASYDRNAGMDPQSFVNNQFKVYDQRRASNGGPQQQAIASAQRGVPMPGGQFDDPYTSLFENVSKQYLERLTGQNAEMDRLMKFIGDQFGQLSTSQGYTPDQQAVLRTQALEPIEADRKALGQRTLERTAMRGMLPSSGLNELDMREVDRQAEQRRTVAQRDLAINGINKQQADLNQALQLAQLGVQIPNQQGQQAMSVANQLYQLPRNSLMDSLQVLNSSSPQSAISPLIQLQQQSQQQAQYDQQRTAQMWQSIGQILAGMNF